MMKHTGLPGMTVKKKKSSGNLMPFKDVSKSATKLLIFGYHILTCLSSYGVKKVHVYKKKCGREKEKFHPENITLCKRQYAFNFDLIPCILDCIVQ